MNTIRWGIIGCGDVTEVKSGPAFQKASGSALVAVMRRDAAKAADYARRHNVPRWYDEADRLIADPEVDAVYIATPPGTHELYAHKVCAAGKPCYVEKPMARNAAEAQRMVDAFAKAKLPLFVAYYRRALPRFVKVKQIIESGVLGPLRSVSYSYSDDQMARRADPIPWRLQAEHAGAGLFLDLASHALDLLDFLISPLVDMTGEAANRTGIYDAEDYIGMTFRFAGRVAGAAVWDFGTVRHEDDYVINGELATLRFSCFKNEPVRLLYKRAGLDRFEEFEIPHPPHVQQPLIQSVVDGLLGVAPVGSCPSTGESAVRTQRAMDQALESYYGGREDGFWTRRRR